MRGDDCHEFTAPDPAYRPVSAVATAVPSRRLPPPASPVERRGRCSCRSPIGAAVAVALGVYGRLHEPTFIAVNLAGFSGPLAAKAWLATGSVLLALVQLISALAMYGKLPGVTAPSWTGTLHRWSGRAGVPARGAGRDPLPLRGGLPVRHARGC